MIVILMKSPNHNLSICQDLRKTTLEWTDKRLKMINEVLQGVRVLKFYAWEESYGKIVSGLRENEVSAIRSMGYLGAGAIL